MIIAWIALIVCIIGAMTYVLETNPKIQEIGRIAYAFGLLVTLWHLGTAVARLP